MRAWIFILAPLLTVLFRGPVFAVSVDDLIFQGSDYQYRGELEKAAQAFTQALRLEPDNEFALNKLAVNYVKQEKFDQAGPLFEKVVRLSPDNTFARLWIGLLHLKENNTQKAFEEFERILSMDPENANAYYFTGVIYAVEHNPQKAVEFLRKAQKTSSDDPETHFRLANAFLGMDMAVNAELEFKRTLGLYPKHTKALNGLGWLFFNQGQKSLALDSWVQVLKINPKDPEARSNLAKVYNDDAFAAYRKGDAAEAERLWKKTLSYEPKNKAALHYLRKLR
ncbi:MAG: tetratricopeptide repeat protein [Thermodesulfobacteriota bacterium]|nr:tetratricopeptide repeat protein [Thermodesulfobacteriota bacterium]